MRRVPLPMKQPFLAPSWCPFPIIMPGVPPHVLRSHWNGALIHGLFTLVPLPPKR